MERDKWKMSCLEKNQNRLPGFLPAPCLILIVLGLLIRNVAAENAHGATAAAAP